MPFTQEKKKIGGGANRFRSYRTARSLLLQEVFSSNPVNGDFYSNNFGFVRKTKMKKKKPVLKIKNNGAVVLAQLPSRAAASDTRGLQFEFSHQQTFKENLITVNSIEKTKMKKKKHEMAHF